jgi:acyl-homoserine-lactone acylase
MKSVSRFFKTALVVLCFFKLFTGSAYGQTHQPQILWDDYGVPHIYSNTTAGMYYSFGWATMHNHANLVLQLYGQARGRGAEYWGGQFLQGDEIVQKFELPRIANEIYLKQHPQYKSYLDAFVKGENDYCKAHPEAIAEKNRQVLPLTPQDVISHTIQVFSIDFVAIDNIYGALSDADERPGSNAMAIGPSRSASKNALLLTNPHLPWGGLATFFEAHLNARGFNAYGVTFVGLPVLVIAFNQNLGWTHTVNPINASTRYELTLKDNGYLLDGAVALFKTKTVTIKIRQDDGSMKDEQLICKYASQGPVVAENKNHAYAIRIAGLNNAFLYEQYHKMAQASNLKEFESAEKMLQMPMFNTTYADKA